MGKINELDQVVLLVDVSEGLIQGNVGPVERVKAGDVGIVVLVHGESEAFEIEFLTHTGHTAAVVGVAANQVRPVSERDAMQARVLEPTFVVTPSS